MLTSTLVLALLCALPTDTDTDEKNPDVVLGELPSTLKPGDAEIFSTARDHARSSERLKALGGLRRTIRIDVLGDPKDERLANVPEWAGGFAVSATQVYVLSPYIGVVGGGRPRDWLQLTLHEIAHAQQRQWTGEAYVPRWFVEGYAMYVARQEPAVSRSDISWWAIRHGNAAPLTNAFQPGAARPTLNGHQRADHALMDYGLALEGVRFLVEKNNEAAIAQFLIAMRGGLDFEKAFRATFKQSVSDFENDLLAHLKPSYLERAE